MISQTCRNIIRGNCILNSNIFIEANWQLQLTMSSAECQPCGPGLNVLTHWPLWCNDDPSSLSSLVKTMAFSLFGAKPLPEPVKAYCQIKYKSTWKFYNWLQVNLSENVIFHEWPFLVKGLWLCNMIIEKHDTSLSNYEQLHVFLTQL